jgi:hypothetical protein
LRIRGIEDRLRRTQLRRSCGRDSSERSPANRSCSEGDDGDYRTQRRNHHAARIDAYRLGSRTRRDHRQQGAVRPKERALDYVAGYCIVNDVSERYYQKERWGQWTKGKSCDTFCPMGPWLVTHDEIPDPQALDLHLDVNGRRRQTGNTRTMIFGVAHLVSYISEFMTLLPGDLIATGTPPGVGLGEKPPSY